MSHQDDNDDDETNETTTTNHAAPQSIFMRLANRFSQRIDQLWLGSVVLIEVLVWQFVGMEYVVAFLCCFYLLFTVRLRPHIKALFPPTGHVVYSDISGIINPHTSATTKIWKGRILFFTFGLPVIVFSKHTDWESISTTGLTAGIWVSIAMVNYFFLLRHKEFFSRFTGDCLIFQRTKNVDGVHRYDRYMTHCVRFFQRLRPVGAIVLAVLCFGGLLWFFKSGVLDSDTQRDAFTLSIGVNAGLYAVIQLSLISLEDRS